MALVFSTKTRASGLRQGQEGAALTGLSRETRHREAAARAAWPHHTQRRVPQVAIAPRAARARAPKGRVGAAVAAQGRVVPLHWLRLQAGEGEERKDEGQC